MERIRKQVQESEARVWASYRDRRLADGVSLWRIAGELTGRFTQQTVYNHIAPHARQRRNERQRRILRQPNQRARHNRYNRLFRRLTSPAYQRDFLFTALAGSLAGQGLDVIAERVNAELGSSFRADTVRRNLLERYQAWQHANPARGPPYLAECSEGWRLQHERPSYDAASDRSGSEPEA